MFKSDVKHKQTKKLDKLHFRALKFVYQDFTSSFENLLIRADTYSLNVKRIRLIALEIFKIISGDRPSYLSKLIIRKYSCRYSNMLQVLNVRTERYGRNSFRFNCTQIWNTLPEHIRTKTKLSNFKKLISTWNCNECKCAACR